MNMVAKMPEVRGKLTPNAPLAPLVWFKSGGKAEWLFEPKDLSDLQSFLRGLAAEVQVWPLGLGSNLIVRDGGKQGVTVRLGKAFSAITMHSNESDMIICGAGAPGISAASFARDNSLSRLEMLRGIPGTIGGAVRMNAGAYGVEMSDVLVSADVVYRDGSLETISCDDLGYKYRYSSLRDDAIVVSAMLRGTPSEKNIIAAEMKRIGDERENTQPLRSKTGGSTFKNPDGQKAWQLVDEAGCRGLRMGQAQVSEKHCNFLINLGGATSQDIETLGEEVRKRVKANSGIELQWEIQRIGEKYE